MVKEIWIDDILSGQYDDQEVELKGWIHRSRGSNKIRFIVIRDSTGHIQCVAKREPLGDELEQFILMSVIEILLNIKRLTSYLVQSRVAVLFSKYHILVVKMCT